MSLTLPTAQQPLGADRLGSVDPAPPQAAGAVAAGSATQAETRLTTARGSPLALLWAACVVAGIALVALLGHAADMVVLANWMPTSQAMEPRAALLWLAFVIGLLGIDRRGACWATLGAGWLLAFAGLAIAVAEQMWVGTAFGLLGITLLLIRPLRPRLWTWGYLSAGAVATVALLAYLGYALPVVPALPMGKEESLSAPGAMAALVAAVMLIAHLVARRCRHDRRPALSLSAHSLVVGWTILATLIAVLGLWVIGGVDRSRISDAFMLQREHAVHGEERLVWRAEMVREDLEDLGRAPAHRSLVDAVLAGEVAAGQRLQELIGGDYRSAWVRPAGAESWWPLWSPAETVAQDRLDLGRAAASGQHLVLAGDRLVLIATRRQGPPGDDGSIELALVAEVGDALQPTGATEDKSRVVVADLRGRQLSSSVDLEPATLAALLDWLRNVDEEGGARQGSYGEVGATQLLTAQPLRLRGNASASHWLLLTLPQERVLAGSRGADFLLVACIWFVASLIGLLVSFLIRGWTRPIERSARLLARLSRSVPSDDAIQAGADLPEDVARLARSAGLVQAQLEEHTMLLVAARDRLAAQQSQLARSNRDLQQFAYIASHDLQEPLRQVEMFVDLLVEEEAAALSTDGHEYLERMRSASLRMRRMVQSLLAYSRASTGEIEVGTVDLAETMLVVQNDLACRIRETGAAIEVGPLPVVTADPSQMEQVFANLVGNALKFCEGRPHIRIATEPDDPRAVVVSDNGIGFDQTYADQALQPFRRLHSRDRYPGSGIGLATCQRICERIGAELTITSSVGKGTTVRIHFPVGDSPSGAAESAGAEQDRP